jgi:sphingosine kinase
MAGSHQHPLLQSSEQEYGSPVAVLKFAAQAASGRLRSRLLELQIDNDGACSIVPLEDSSALLCGGLLSNISCGTTPPDEIAAADIVGASTSGSGLTIWHAPLDKPHADKPTRHMRRTALQLESAEAAAQAAAHLRSSCCWQGYEGQVAPRLLLIVNPASGPGKAPAIYERQVLPALQAAGARLTMHTTRQPLHATEIVKAVAPGSVDCIVAIGGDGTMYEVLQGMLARPDWQPLAALPFAQIPCGSGNALAASMGMWNVATAVHAIVKGQQRALDIATVLQASPPRRCFSFLSINFGLVTNLDIGTEHLRWMGGTRFVVGALQQIMLKRKHAARVAILEPGAAAADSGSSAAAADGRQSAAQPPAAGQQQAEALAAAAAQPGPPVQQLEAFQHLAARQLPPGWQWLPDPEVALFTATNLPRLDMNFHLAPEATPDSGKLCGTTVLRAIMPCYLLACRGWR